MPVPGCWETRCAWDPVVLHGPAKHSISVSDGLTHPGISPFIPTGAVGIGAMHPRQSRVGGVRERLPAVGSQAPRSGGGTGARFQGRCRPPSPAGGRGAAMGRRSCPHFDCLIS